MKTIPLLTFILHVCVPAAICAEFWGSKKSNKYHYPACQWAQKINPGNPIRFNSPREAIRAGYVPRKVRRPPGR